MFNTFNRVNLASGIGATRGPGSGVIADTIGDFNGAPGIGPRPKPSNHAAGFEDHLLTFC